MSDEREITAKINTEELIMQWNERADRARGIKTVFSIGARTDLGCIRENNEDKYEFFIPEEEEICAIKGSFFAVADGMGGHSAGQIASELALKTAISSYYEDKSPIIEDILKAALQKANAIVFESSRAIADRSGMGTTMTSLVIRGEDAYIAHVGDSRCYLFRKNKLFQITDDHSWVNEQIKRGGMTEEEAMLSPYRNIITRSLGNNPNVDVDIYSEQIHEGDVFLLCSDGLSGEVSDDEIETCLKNKSPSKAAWDLVDLALEHGGHDNTTVLIIKIKNINKDKSKHKGLRGFLNRS